MNKTRTHLRVIERITVDFRRRSLSEARKSYAGVELTIDFKPNLLLVSP